ncbi:MAG: sulfatase [Verrucomicrobia bacterium]|nr:sulfatase [Verrucomicrobiota bacterium]
MNIKHLAFLFLAFAAPALADPAKPYNILMIAVDDLNDWVGAFGGNPQAKTPNMDRLAQSSMLFRNASCAGPVCGPSRSALLSGFRPSTTGAYGNDTNMLSSTIVQTHATLPEYFSKNGYTTISSGKIFHKHETAAGFDSGHWAYDVWGDELNRGGQKDESVYSRNKGIIAGKKIDNPKHKVGGGSEFSWGVTEKGKEFTQDYRTAKWFENQLQEQHGKPFFMLAGISKPHLSWFVPQEYYDMHPLQSIKVPEFRMDDLDDIGHTKRKRPFEPEADFLWVQEYGLHQRAVQAYLAACSYADDCIGVMLDALKKSPYADNTIVVIWGDHGWHLGEKLRFRKATLWKEATQMPLIVHVPGMDTRKDCYRNVNLLDLYPTLIELCGLPAKKLEGKSFKPLLENPDQPWTPTVTTAGKGNHSVMSEKWHYITYGGEVEELYDMEKDPMEWKNLASEKSPDLEAIKAHLRTFLPTNEVDSLPESKEKKPKKGGEEAPEPIDGKTRAVPDPTIKPRRNLAELQ